MHTGGVVPILSCWFHQKLLAFFAVVVALLFLRLRYIISCHVIGVTEGRGSGAIAVATGTAASPHIIVSWYLVSRSSFFVKNGRLPARLYHVSIDFLCATVHSADCLFRVLIASTLFASAVCASIFLYSCSLCTSSAHLFLFSSSSTTLKVEAPACSDMKTGCVSFIACNRPSCCSFSLLLMIAILYNLINRGSSDDLAQV